METPGFLCRMVRGALCAFALLLTAPGMPAFGAEGPHEFDPNLSLTGTCVTSKVDEVPDPGCPGGDHPGSFRGPIAVITDGYGDIYLASLGKANPEGRLEGRVDVFDPEGFLITSLNAEEGLKNGPEDITVDAECNLYVIDSGYVGEESELRRYPPEKCNPAAGEIEYGKAPVVVADNEELCAPTSCPASSPMALAIDPLDQHLFVNESHQIVEFASAVEGNELIEVFGTLNDTHGGGLAIDAKRGLIYVTDHKEGNQSEPRVVKALELEAPHAVVGEINGSCTASGEFLSPIPSVTVDEGTGDVFVYDGAGAEVVYEFSAAGGCIATVDYELQGHYVLGAQITVDNGAQSLNGAKNPFERYLFVPAFFSPGHLLAFGRPPHCLPEIESSGFSGATESEVLLQARVNPCFLPTTYTFEYTTLQHYKEEGNTFNGATLAGEGQIPPRSATSVAAAAKGLLPGTRYRFRVLAENELGAEEDQGEFATYPQAETSPPCANDPFRAGVGALLPDCRAYELVTPPDTNARTPKGVQLLGPYFTTREASPAGDAASFLLEGGSLPGDEGTGSFSGDTYLVRRSQTGWETTYAGPTGAEAAQVLPGGNSPDQGYALWSSAGGEGSANVEGKSTSYLRYPNGHSALLGRGTLADDPFAEGKLIAEGGRHVIFASTDANGHSAVKLTEDAPPDGTAAVYDRTIGAGGEEETHLVSLLPGEITPEAGENASYEGASLDGKGIAFKIANTLFLRSEDEESFEVGEGLTFAGIAEGGERLFYLKGDDLYRFDANSGETTPFTTSGDVTPVNVAAEGAVAYFVSPSALTDAEESNPSGAVPVEGEENLYRSQEGTISFVATVTEEDVAGKETGVGLGLWTPHVVSYGEAGEEPSRTTSDGGVLLFESRAKLTEYDSEGHAEVYRYDFAAETLECLSCNPTLAPASGGANLQSLSFGVGDEASFSYFASVANVSADGRRAFFQSTEALVPGDTDQLQDVYEWEKNGIGSCEHPGGCLFLVSSGHSDHNDYLYAVSDSGDDVFLRSPDLLLRADLEETPSIYDARVNGGFPEPEPRVCEGEACRPQLTPPPTLPTPGMLPGGGSGNLPRSCPKGTRKVRRAGKVHCVKKHYRRHRHHRRAGSGGKGAGR